MKSCFIDDIQNYSYMDSCDTATHATVLKRENPGRVEAYLSRDRMTTL